MANLTASPQDAAGAATSIGAFVASVPLSYINEWLTMIALIVSISVGIGTWIRWRRGK